MTSSLDHAIDKLTLPWTDVQNVDGKYTAVEHEPMLDMLHTAIGSSMGRTESGRSEADARNVLNVRAFTLWERIDGQARAWLLEIHAPAPRDLKAAVRALKDRVNALWADNNIRENQYLRFGSMTAQWVEDIWAVFDPPVEKEIVGACPSCGERDHFGSEGERSAAIIAFYWRGVSPAAQCRRCQREWNGEKALLELGYHIGATVDEEALRDMGVL